MKYTQAHDWLRLDGDLVVVGVTEHALSELGEVVFVELPTLETVLAEGDEAVVLEGADGSAEILCPLDGEVVEVNPRLADSPRLVTADPLGAGWFFKLRVDDPDVLDDLMDEDEYEELVAP